jgi:hypothetical protein
VSDVTGSAAGTPYNSPFEAQFDEGRAQEFMILKLLRDLHTATIVQVQQVEPITASVGVVTVIPMILDTATNALVLDQSAIYQVPYFRLQGGSSAVIIDPAVDDIGLAVFAEADITNVVMTQKSGPPQTQRRHSSADGMYFGGFLNAAPTQWVKFLAGGGIDISTPGNLTLEGENVTITSSGTTTIDAAGGLTINANVTLNGSLNSTPTGANTVTFASKIVAPDIILPNGPVNPHVHPVTAVGSNTGTMTG